MKEFKEEDASTWTYPCIVIDEAGFFQVVLSQIGANGCTFHSELPPEGWTAKGEFPREVEVEYCGEKFVGEVFYMGEELSLVRFDGNQIGWFNTCLITEIDHEREQKLKELSELEEKVKLLKTELGV